MRKTGSAYVAEREEGTENQHKEYLTHTFRYFRGKSKCYSVITSKGEGKKKRKVKEKEKREKKESLVLRANKNHDHKNVSFVTK